MSKIDLRVFNLGERVHMIIEKQCESITNNKPGELLFHASNGIVIKSCWSPKLSHYPSIYIVGSEGFPHDSSDVCCTTIFESKEEAEMAVEFILEAFQEFKENNYFDGPHKSTPVEDSKYRLYKF